MAISVLIKLQHLSGVTTTSTPTHFTRLATLVLLVLIVQEKLMKVFISAQVDLTQLLLEENAKFALLESTVKLQHQLPQIAPLVITQQVVWFLVRDVQWVTDVWIKRELLYFMRNLASDTKLMYILNVQLGLVAQRLIQRMLTLAQQVLTLKLLVRRIVQSAQQAISAQAAQTSKPAQLTRSLSVAPAPASTAQNTTCVPTPCTWSSVRLCSTRLQEILSAHFVRMGRSVVIIMRRNLILVLMDTTLLLSI